MNILQDVVLLGLDCPNLLCHWVLFIVLPFTQTCLKMLPFDVWKSAFFRCIWSSLQEEEFDFFLLLLCSLCCLSCVCIYPYSVCWVQLNGWIATLTFRIGLCVFMAAHLMYRVILEHRHWSSSFITVIIHLITDMSLRTTAWRLYKYLWSHSFGFWGNNVSLFVTYCWYKMNKTPDVVEKINQVQ